MSIPSSSVHGPLGKGRSTGLVILVTIVTFGIWTLVWSYQNGEEMFRYRNSRGTAGVLYLVLTLFVAPATMFLMADEVSKMYAEEGEVAPITVWWGMWFLLPLIGPLIWYVRIQGAFNDFWVQRGAEPASGL